MSPDTPRARLLALGAGKPTIEVLEAGEGPPLLFLHGAGGVPAWEGVLPLLSRHYHVYAPLLPGFGQSTGLDHLDDQWDLFLHGFDVLEALGLERPYVLGESLGGWLAAEMAALRPKEIGRLALAAPLGLWRDEAPVVDLFGHMTHELVPYLFHDPETPAAQRMLALTSLFSEKDDRTEEQVELLIGLVRGLRTAAKFLFPIPERGLEKRLPRITAPTLVVWGDGDRFVAPLYARLFADRIPGARLAMIERAGHLIGLERPEPYADAVVRWGREGR
jgi:pimeloyl-ACP methyl ester carboxylesterase